MNLTMRGAVRAKGQAINLPEDKKRLDYEQAKQAESVGARQQIKFLLPAASSPVTCVLSTGGWIDQNRRGWGKIVSFELFIDQIKAV
jgi:hypothetical protein